LKVNVKLGTRFKDVFDKEDMQVELEEGKNVRDLLDALFDTKERRERLFSGSGNLRSNVMVTKNRRFIIHLNWLNTALEDGDNIEIRNLVSGG
jgi:molybdopterin synthase sulfur carrier subunit